MSAARWTGRPQTVRSGIAPTCSTQLWVHGVQPTHRTPPERVRDFVRDLYKYQIRRLRERYLRREFPKLEYSQRVDALRRQYPVLALRAQDWLER